MLAKTIRYPWNTKPTDLPRTDLGTGHQDFWVFWIQSTKGPMALLRWRTFGPTAHESWLNMAQITGSNRIKPVRFETEEVSCRIPKFHDLKLDWTALLGVNLKLAWIKTSSLPGFLLLNLMNPVVKRSHVGLAVCTNSISSYKRSKRLCKASLTIVICGVDGFIQLCVFVKTCFIHHYSQSIFAYDL